MQNFVMAFALAASIAYIMTPVAIKLAYRLGAIDIPKDDRRVHSRPIPRLGGVAIYAGFVIGTLSAVPVFPELIGILIASTIMVLAGIYDDTKGLKPKHKLLIQIICAVIVIYFGVQMEFITNPFSSRERFIFFGFLSIPLTIFWIVGITNTVNLIDGLDGLAAGISAISAGTLALISITNGQTIYATILFALAGAAVGFLPYNFNPAKIFMGDTGSLFLGFILSVISVEAAIKSAAALAVVVPILALAIPILDTTFAIIRRANSGRSIMEADKGHLHHRLLNKGLTQRQTVIALYVISLIMGISAVLISKLSFHAALVVLILDLGLIVYGVFRLNILSHFKEDHNQEKQKKEDRK